MSSFNLDTFGPCPGTLTYRVYRLSASGSIEGVEHIEAHTDDDAMRLVARMANGNGVDLWERARFLGSFPPLGAAVPGAIA